MNTIKYPKHDIHVHTHLSLCASPEALADKYIELAEKNGLSVLGFSDHFWDETVSYNLNDFYKKQDLAHVFEIKKKITAKSDKVKILIGVETEFCMAEKLGISEEVAEKFDFVLVPHSHTHMLDFVMPAQYDGDFDKHSDYLVRSFLALCKHPLKKCITCVAHPFLPVAKTREYKDQIIEKISDSRFDECFCAAKDAGIGIEINTSFFKNHSDDEIRNDSYMRVLSSAKKCGCKFSIGSDAHHPDNVRSLTKAAIVQEIIGITENDYIDLVK